jgi:hypothetical protein
MADNRQRMEEYEEILKTDAEAIESYIRDYYSLKVPPPEEPTKKDKSFWKIAGIDTTLFSIAALAAAIVSSVRTGGLFYILEEKLLEKFNLTGFIPQLLGTVVLVSSLAAFEGYLIAYGFAKGRNLMEVKVSRTGMIASFIVILAAGIFSGIGIITLSSWWEQFLNISLALVTAIGAAIVTVSGGENIGFSMNKFDTGKKKIESDFQDSYNTWKKKAVQSYSTSHYRLQRVVQPVSNLDNNLDGSQLLSNSPVQNVQKKGKSRQALDAIDIFVQKENRLPTVREVVESAKAYGVEISHGTVGSVINRYILENQDVLRASGIASEERIVSAIDFMNRKGGDAGGFVDE